MRTPPADCIAAAQAADKRWGVFASVSLAQGIDESAWFTRMTGRFNVFGIKAFDPAEPGEMCWTHEEVGGKLVACQQRFASYASVADAFDAHARLIATDPRYAAAMRAKADRATFVTLMAQHYATDPGYAGKIKALISEEGLGQYDGAAVSAPISPLAVEPFPTMVEV